MARKLQVQKGWYLGMNRMLVLILVGVILSSSLAWADVADIGSTLIGPESDGGYVVATTQLLHPAGVSLGFHGRPTDVVLSPDGRVLYAKYNGGLLAIDTSEWKIVQNSIFPESDGSMCGLAITRDGSRIYVSTSGNNLYEVTTAANGSFTWGRKIVFPGPDGTTKSAAVVCGIALSRDERAAYVCLSRNNSLGIVDLESGKLLKQIPVGVAPFDVVLSPDGRRAFVSNWAGRHPRKGEQSGITSGSRAVTDERGICSSGTVSVVDLKRNREVAELETGLHPSDMVLSPDGRTLYVANANSDTVSIIDTKKQAVEKTISVRPDPKLPFGSAPDALVLSRDGKTLYVANGGNNAVAVIELKNDGKAGSPIQGFIPTEWYPGGLASDGENLYIANIKGIGARYKSPGDKGWNTYGYEGTVSKVPLPNADQLAKYTARVRSDARVPQILRSYQKAETGEKPVPVPQHVGEPSVFDHVVYIIKENKTYDEVFGDLPKGNNDPNLCIYGQNVTPNHHALAEQFVELDNYYCNGVLSADGHSWVTEGNASDYLEKSFGGFPRSYGSEDDCVTPCSSGFIWDDALSHGLSFRNYGEFGYGEMRPKGTWKAVYDDYINKTGKFKYNGTSSYDTLRTYGCMSYPGWNLTIPDAVRADIFLREFKKYEKKGDWPNLVTIYLPDDHTAGGISGMPTPRAEVADNDLALGRIVEAISKSPFWAKTCIFVEEDDTQSGFDHVDGHRSLCLVISPYTKRGTLISRFYNQDSVLHTMELMLGIPPMNQMDAMSPPMTECFMDTPDLTPYTCIPNNVPLDEMSENQAYHYRGRTKLAEKEYAQSFSSPDAINDDKVNRMLWLMAKGPNVPYPAEYCGAHGKGLAALHLKLADEADE